MKSKLLLFICCLLVFALKTSAQTKEARKIDEFPYLPCDDLLAHVDSAYQQLQNDSDAKIYFIYYEAKQYSNLVYNEKAKKSENKLVNPRHGDALNRTKDLTLYLTKWRKTPKEKLVLINGGYMENYEVEIWIVPKDAEMPKPTPTVKEKDIKFREGKPFRVRDCQAYYQGI